MNLLIRSARRGGEASNRPPDAPTFLLREWTALLMLEEHTGGRCMYRDCRYLREGGHPGHNDIPDDFAEKVCAVISPGIQARMQPGGGEGSPGKKLKLETASQA
jgi:hypothetical protein